MEKLSIKQVEPRFAQELETPLKETLKKLGYSIPEKFRLRVSLLQANGRKKRSNAAADAWAPESDRLEFWLEPCTTSEPAIASKSGPQPAVAPLPKTHRETLSPGLERESIMHPAEADLLKALDRAESIPGWNFVSLKKFRDEILPSADVPSIRSDVERQTVLASAIEKRFILTSKVQNPKSPQFPVTSIRLNRLMPEVQQVLGLPKKNLDFHPIHIKGEPLSATILRERR